MGQDVAGITVRTADAGDVSAVVRLLATLGYPTTAAQVEQRLAAFLGSAMYLTLVACDGPDVLGLAAGLIRFSIEHDAPAVELTALVVADGSQHKGIGRLLTTEVERWARERGARSVIVTTATHRSGAHEFYRCVGYEETGLRFVKRLS
jgi:predicted N-acetyltransferase YhbS